MAQQWENKEETGELTFNKTPQLCINNCGLPGNPNTENMCSLCFKAAASLAVHKRPVSFSSSEDPARSELTRTAEEKKEKVVVEEKKMKTSVGVNRCAGCRKKVGLTGIRCRCGGLYCSVHRYSDRHSCGFDYKKAGREAISRENPFFKAAKIVRF